MHEIAFTVNKLNQFVAAPYSVSLACLQTSVKIPEIYRKLWFVVLQYWHSLL